MVYLVSAARSTFTSRRPDHYHYWFHSFY